MDTAPFMFVPLLQVSLALGLMYLGLRAARYRNRLHSLIISSLEKQGIKRIRISRQRYGQLLIDSPECREAHATVSKWVRALPEALYNQLEGTAASFFLKVGETEKPPCIYQWYKKNADRNSTWCISVIAPIVLLWVLAIGWNPDQAIEIQLTERLAVGGTVGWRYAWVLVAWGQLWVLVHVLIGRWIIVNKYHAEFKTELELLFSELAIADALKARDQI